jgi:hypothetical protein
MCSTVFSSFAPYPCLLLAPCPSVMKVLCPLISHILTEEDFLRSRIKPVPIVRVFKVDTIPFSNGMHLVLLRWFKVDYHLPCVALASTCPLQKILVKILIGLEAACDQCCLRFAGGMFQPGPAKMSNSEAYCTSLNRGLAHSKAWNRVPKSMLHPELYRVRIYHAKLLLQSLDPYSPHSIGGLTRAKHNLTAGL